MQVKKCAVIAISKNQNYGFKSKTSSQMLGCKEKVQGHMISNSMIYLLKNVILHP